MTSHGSISIKWDAARDPSGVAGYVVQYGVGSYDSSQWFTTTVSTTSFNGLILRDGAYNYRVFAVDKYDNVSSQYLSGSFIAGAVDGSAIKKVNSADLNGDARADIINFIPIPKKGNAKECSNYRTIALISHISKVMLKILQARLQQ